MDGPPTRPRRRLYPSKYQPLTAVLSTEAGDRIQLTFQQIEAVLGTALPSGAWRRRQWWSDQRQYGPQVKAWQEAGWHDQDVDLAAEQVTHVRHALRTAQ